MRRKSLNEPDLEKSKIALAQFVMLHSQPTNAGADEIRIAQVLVPYISERTDKLASAEQARISGRLIGEFFGGDLVSDITPQRQREFINWLSGEKGHSPAYIGRTQSVLSAALGRARKEGVLMAHPQIIMSTAEIADLVDAPPPIRRRRLTLDELAAFMDALPRKRFPHVFRYVMVALNTVARPDAICELTRFQIDDEIGVIHLNPAGRRQTKKFRPVVPITDTLKSWLNEWQDGKSHIVCLKNGNPIENPKKAIRAAAVRAGLQTEEEWSPDRNVTPYTLRRTMARMLRARSVPIEHISGMMGHKLKGFSTTEIYADAGYDDIGPDHLHLVREGIDAIMADLDAKTEITIRHMPKPKIHRIA